jgi:hypothetical protein
MDSGDFSFSQNTGDFSFSENAGDFSFSENTGDFSFSDNTGDFSFSQNTVNLPFMQNTSIVAQSTYQRLSEPDIFLCIKQQPGRSPVTISTGAKPSKLPWLDIYQ